MTLAELIANRYNELITDWLNLGEFSRGAIVSAIAALLLFAGMVRSKATLHFQRLFFANAVSMLAWTAFMKLAKPFALEEAVAKLGDIGLSCLGTAFILGAAAALPPVNWRASPKFVHALWIAGAPILNFAFLYGSGYWGDKHIRDVALMGDEVLSAVGAFLFGTALAGYYMAHGLHGRAALGMVGTYFFASGQVPEANLWLSSHPATNMGLVLLAAVAAFAPHGFRPATPARPLRLAVRQNFWQPITDLGSKEVTIMANSMPNFIRPTIFQTRPGGHESYAR